MTVIPAYAGLGRQVMQMSLMAANRSLLGGESRYLAYPSVPAA